MNKFSSDTKDSHTYIVESLDYFIKEFSLAMEMHPDLEERRGIFSKVLTGELNKDQFDFANNIAVLKRVFNSKSGVMVSTCHGVKGEEYDTVIAFGLLDGYIPNWNDPDDLAANKLLYVICSRAKRYLYLFSERGYLIKGRDRRPTDVLAEVKYTYDKLDPADETTE